MSHASIYIAICIASMGGVVILGAPELKGLVFASALAIALVGVPHGGLDHWTGRRLLTGYLSDQRLASHWWVLFFPAYFMIAMAFAAAWIVLPVATVMLFFLASAWHFGREDDQSVTGELLTATPTRWVSHLTSTALGGLAIWVPAWLRPDEMFRLLTMIVPQTNFSHTYFSHTLFSQTNVEAAQQIVLVTRWIALILVPWAAIAVAQRIRNEQHVLRNWVPLATTALAACTPILLSFSIFFCGWHSIQGLRRLQHDERLPSFEFTKAVLPLSALAVAGVTLTGWYLLDTSSVLANDAVTATLQTLFIGLSAIAVPHLVLHELQRHLTARHVTPIHASTEVMTCN